MHADIRCILPDAPQTNTTDDAKNRPALVPPEAWLTFLRTDHAARHVQDNRKNGHLTA
jgi:hypothetical protein